MAENMRALLSEAIDVAVDTDPLALRDALEIALSFMAGVGKTKPGVEHGFHRVLATSLGVPVPTEGGALT
jgi:hypothetical protein